MSVSYNDAIGAVPKPVAAAVDREGKFWVRDQPVFVPNTRELVKGGLFAEQRTWWDLDNFIRILVGGYGSGKTLTGCKRAINLALLNAPVPIAVVSPTYKVAKETVVITIMQLLTGKQSLYGKRRFWWRYFRSDGEFHIRYAGREARILIYSGDRPENLKGPNLGGALIDEPFIQDQVVFDEMIARCRHPLAKKIEINLTGTPEQLNWGFDLCLGELGERHDVGFTTMSTYSNATLDPLFFERLEASFTEKAGEAFIHGKFMNLSEGTIYYGFSMQDNMVARKIPDGAEIAVGMDFNVNPMAAVVFWKWRDQIHFMKEYELANADTELMCQTLREDFGTAIRRVFPDASGKARHTNAPGGRSDFTYLEEYDFEVCCKLKNPRLKDRWNAANSRFKAKNGRVLATVDPSCKKLVKYLATHSHEMRTKQERFTHLLDAATYPLAYLFPVDKGTMVQARLRGA